MKSDKQTTHHINRQKTPYTIISLDKMGCIQSINQQRNNRLDIEYFIGKPFSSIAAVCDQELVRMKIEHVMKMKETITYEFRARDKSHYHVTKIPIVLNDEFQGIHVICEKIPVKLRESEDKSEQYLNMSLEKYKDLIEKAFFGVYIIQHDLLIFVNDWITEMLGVPKENLLGTNFIDVIKKEDRERVKNNYRKLLAREEKYLVDEIQIVNPFGEIKYWELQSSYTFLNGEFSVIGVAMDVTEKKKIKADFEYYSFHDGLLRLPNMNYLNHVISKELEIATSNGQSFCMMFFDLDGFKLINDSYGHKVGDQVLKITAKRLVDALKDTGTIVRAGGDELIINLPNVNKSRANNIAKNLLKIISEPFVLEDIEMRLSASIGIAFLQKNEHLEELLQKASAALNYAKVNGRNQYQFFSNEHREIANKRIKLEQGLRMALEKQELEIYYQPKLDLFTNKITGCEALLRWNDTNFGYVSPAEFIPIAEETGLINAIGKWVLLNACYKNSMWQKEDALKMDICVNISSIQFLQDDFVSMVEEILLECKLPPEHLNLEITEGIAINNMENAIEKLNKLKELGVRISLDDFGTGYSSLNYLKFLPIDYLKIDRSFINGVLDSKQDTEIIRSIISMAHSLGHKVVAEGIEEEQQLLFLKQMGCDEIQGFYLAKPMPPDQLEKFLIERKIKITN